MNYFEKIQILGGINSQLNVFNPMLDSIKYKFLKIDTHFLDRIDDRKFDMCDVSLVYNYFFKNKLCQFIYEIECIKYNNIKFAIQYDTMCVLHGTVTRFDDATGIKIRTIVPYHANYKPDKNGILFKVNKLKRASPL